VAATVAIQTVRQIATQTGKIMNLMEPGFVMLPAKNLGFINALL
jgi:hypothetical protein